MSAAVLHRANANGRDVVCGLQGFMLRNAVLQLPPLRTRPWTFLTSNFSHAGTLHLAVNMLALSSFGSVVAEV